VGIAVTDDGTVFLSSSKEHALLSMKEEEMLKGFESQTKVSGETAGHRDGVKRRWNMPSALCVYRNTVFVCDIGNKAVKMLTSAKGLIPLQIRMAHSMQTCSDSTRKPTKKTYPVYLKIV